MFQSVKAVEAGNGSGVFRPQLYADVQVFVYRLQVRQTGDSPAPGIVRAPYGEVNRHASDLVGMYLLWQIHFDLTNTKRWPADLDDN